MNLTAQAATAFDASFRDRVLVAIATTAANVVGENPTTFTGGATGAKATKRHALAVQLANNPRGMLEAFCLAVACNATVAAGGTTPPDATLQAACDAAFSNIAGVAFGE